MSQEAHFYAHSRSKLPQVTWHMNKYFLYKCVSFWMQQQQQQQPHKQKKKTKQKQQEKIK